MFLVTAQIVVRAVGDAFQFLHAKGEFVLDVVGLLGVERAFSVRDVQDVEMRPTVTRSRPEPFIVTNWRKAWSSSRTVTSPADHTLVPRVKPTRRTQLAFSASFHALLAVPALRRLQIARSISTRAWAW